MSTGPAQRALPSRPDLEYERKQAKHLLRDAKRGDAAALARIAGQNRSLGGAAPDAIKLADAQLTIAREYGFRSWPLLVQYFETLAIHEKSTFARHDLANGSKDWWAETIVAEHRDRRAWTAMLLGSFVPRLYGASLEEVFASAITIDDARLVVARQHGFTRWENLLAYQAANPRPDRWARRDSPVDSLARAIALSDIDAMNRLAIEHSEVLQDSAHHQRLASAALANGPFPKESSPAVLAWLRQRGIPIQPTLNRLLMGGMGGHMTPEAVQSLLDKGADPAWVAPNGYSVLDYALYRYWNPAAVDLILARVKPRDTFWVSAGVGDVASMRKYFDHSGKLKPSARKDWPDFGALSGRGSASLPNPTDEMLLWEAAFVAAVNARASTFDVLLENGFVIDSHWGMTLLGFAVGNGLLPMVELLVSRGASPHVRGWRPNQTPLEMSVGYLGRSMDKAEHRRIVELLGGDPDVVARVADAERGPPKLGADVARVLEFARRDAVRQGQSAVGEENVFVGLLAESENALVLMGNAGIDLARLKRHYLDRLTPPLSESSLPTDSAVEKALAAARDAATHKKEHIYGWDVLFSMLQEEDGVVTRIAREFGADVQRLRHLAGRMGQPVKPRDK